MKTKFLATGLLVCLALIGVSQLQAETFDSDGAEIAYTVEGAGEPVVLIHGFVLNSDTNYRAPGIIAGLASDYQVIAIDARGHGQSMKSHDPADYGEHMVRDVINLLDHLGIEKAHVAGYSMGGMITQKLVVDYPERLLSAVVAGAGWSSEGMEGFGLPIAQSLESGNGLGPLIIGLNPVGQPVPTAEQIAAINAMILAGNDPLALAAAARGFDAFIQVAEADLRANQVPVLYVAGLLDPINEGAELAAGVASHAQYVGIPDSDHMTAIANPALLTAIKNFLDEPD